MIYLHIGAHKTGTSSIQQALNANRAKLESMGYIVLSDNKASRGAFHGFAHAFEESKVSSIIDAIPVIAATRARILLELDRNYIISAEALEALSSSAIKEVARVLAPHDVRVVVYLRRQEEIIQSKYLQQLKTGGVRCEFEHWFATNYGNADSNNLRTFSYLRMLAKWAEVFGDQSLIVRTFERDRFVKGDLVEDFFSCLGLSEQQRSDLEKIKTANISPSYKSAVLLGALAARNKDADRETVKRCFKSLSSLTQKLGWTTKRSMLSSANVEHIRKLYAQMNQQVAEKYLSDLEGELFPEKAIPFAGPDDDLTPDDLINLISALVLDGGRPQKVNRRSKKKRNKSLQGDAALVTDSPESLSAEIVPKKKVKSPAAARKPKMSKKRAIAAAG